MSAPRVTLDGEQLVQLADLIADRLRRQPAPTGLVTPAQLAALLAVDPKTIYRHADELGVKRIGRALRFEPTAAIAAWERRPTRLSRSDAGAAVLTRKRSVSSSADLLPVGRKR